MATDESHNGSEAVSESKPTDPDGRDRANRGEYSLHHADPRFRHRFNQLIPKWGENNASYFSNRLTPPRFSIGLTTSKRFSETRLNSDYGAPVTIELSERAAFGTDRNLVRTNDLDAPGLLRFLDDRLLGEMVKQFVIEIHGSFEEDWDGYGPLYAREATRIGAQLGLPEVHPRRRGPKLAGQPVAASWPHAFRPEGYYLGHVSFVPRRRGNWGSVGPTSVLPGVAHLERRVHPRHRRRYPHPSGLRRNADPGGRASGCRVR